jgi:2-keto-3-deoxy-L-fuconate dehydrogenase
VTPAFQLTGKPAIVTGAGSGIGKAIALRFAQSGARIFAVDVSADRAAETCGQITSLGGEATALICDVTKSAEVERVIGATAAEQGIDILVNSAGVSHIGRLDNTSEADFDRLFQVNVRGVYLCMKAVLAPMRAAGGGVILNLASIAATAGLSDRFAYSMSKGAVLAMTLSVARDYLQDNIRCNAISPARIHTPFVDAFLKQHYPGREQEMFGVLSKSQPIGRMGTPEEVAALAQFLCSEAGSFLTGADVPFDGGFFNLRG